MKNQRQLHTLRAFYHVLLNELSFIHKDILEDCITLVDEKGHHSPHLYIYIPGLNLGEPEQDRAIKIIMANIDQSHLVCFANNIEYKGDTIIIDAIELDDKKQRQPTKTTNMNTTPRLSGFDHNEELEKIARQVIGNGAIQGALGHNLYFVSMTNLLISQGRDTHQTHDGEPEVYCMVAAFEDKEEAKNFADTIDMGIEKGLAKEVNIENIQGSFYHKTLVEKISYEVVSRFE